MSLVVYQRAEKIYAAIPLLCSLYPRYQRRSAVPRKLFGPVHGYGVFGLPRVRLEIRNLGFDNCKLGGIVFPLLLLCRRQVLDGKGSDRAFPRTDRLVWSVETLRE